MSTPLDHLDRIDQSTYRVEALAAAIGPMAAVDLDSDLIAEIGLAIAEVAAGIRAEAAAMLEETRGGTPPCVSLTGS